MKKILSFLTINFVFAVFSAAYYDIQPESVKVRLERFPPVISASTECSLISKDFQKAIFTVTVLTDNKSEILKTLQMEIIPDPFASRPSQKKGTIIRTFTDASKWLYIAPLELKTEKNPMEMEIKIVPKCGGKICGHPATITVRPVFHHLLNTHADSPETDFRKPTNADYNLAWQYARWKYDIDTSNLTEIKYDPQLRFKGVTYAGLFNRKRICHLGKSAFISENICASVLGHENVHGGQKIWWFFGFREKAEPPAYHWEIENAARLGLPREYIEELKQWRNSYVERDRGSKIRIFLK